MDEADVKTNRNEIEFNSFCLFLSFNFILVFFVAAEKYGERKKWRNLEPSVGSSDYLWLLCLPTFQFLSCLEISSSQQSAGTWSTEWCERSDYSLGLSALECTFKYKILSLSPFVLYFKENFSFCWLEKLFLIVMRTLFIKPTLVVL